MKGSSWIEASCCLEKSICRFSHFFPFTSPSSLSSSSTRTPMTTGTIPLFTKLLRTEMTVCLLIVVFFRPSYKLPASVNLNPVLPRQSHLPPLHHQSSITRARLFLDAATHLYNRVCPSVRPCHVCKTRRNMFWEPWKRKAATYVYGPCPTVLVVYPALFSYFRRVRESFLRCQPPFIQRMKETRRDLFC